MFKELFGDKAVFEDLPGYVKCMSLEYSSEAMWRTYSTSGGLVRLSWKFGQFVEPWEAGQIVTLFKDVLGVPFSVSQSVFDAVYAGPP